MDWQPSSSGTALLPFLKGFIFIAVSAATAPAFIGSKIKTPASLPLTRSSIIWVIGSLVQSTKPPIIFGLVVI